MNTKFSELDFLTPQQQATLGHGKDLSLDQQASVRHAFSEAFHQDMVAAVAVSAAAILVVLGAYRRERVLIADQNQERIKEEMARRAALHKD